MQGIRPLERPGQDLNRTLPATANPTAGAPPLVTPGNPPPALGGALPSPGALPDLGGIGQGGAAPRLPGLGR